MSLIRGKNSVHVRSPLKNINSQEGEGGYSVVGYAMQLKRIGVCKHCSIQTNDLSVAPRVYEIG